MRSPSRVFTACLAAAFAWSHACFSAPTSSVSASQLPSRDKEEAQIPKQPSTPPALFNKAPPETFRCQRLYVYDGRTYSCDSNLRQDGERLRPILEQVPEAVAYLDEYQKSRARLQSTAYVGTAGILVLLVGLFSGSPSDTAKTSIILVGAGLIGTSAISGYAALKANEATLGDAVRTYNQARPDRPIELKFSTGISF